MKTIKTITTILVVFLFTQCGSKDTTEDIIDNSENTTGKATISVIAGSGTEGDVDATGTKALFKGLWDICMDSKGNLFVIDKDAYKIKKITPNGEVSTFAGSTKGTATENIDGTGTAAKFINPTQIAIDSKDNLYILEANIVNKLGKIRKVTPEKEVTTIYNAPENSNAEDIPFDFSVDSKDNLFILFPKSIKKIAYGSNVIEEFMDYYPTDTGINQYILFDSEDNIYVSRIEISTTNIDKITPNKTVTSFIKKSFKLTNVNTAMTIDKNNNIYTTAIKFLNKITPNADVAYFIGNGRAYEYELDEFESISGIVFDKQGNLYVADKGRNQVLKVTL